MFKVGTGGDKFEVDELITLAPVLVTFVKLRALDELVPTPGDRVVRKEATISDRAGSVLEREEVPDEELKLDGTPVVGNRLVGSVHEEGSAWVVNEWVGEGVVVW